jgi:hypothetical protein
MCASEARTLVSCFETALHRGVVCRLAGCEGCGAQEAEGAKGAPPTLVRARVDRAVPLSGLYVASESIVQCRSVASEFAARAACHLAGCSQRGREKDAAGEQEEGEGASGLCTWSAVQA